MDSAPIPPIDPYDHARVEQVEEKHKEPSRGEGGEEPPKEGLAAYLLHLLKKVVTYFIDLGPHEKTADMGENLLALKKALEILKKEDRSEDIHFLNRLSEIWQALLEESLKWDALRPLIKKIERYPEQAKHTLGYYLTEYAGQKWIPFPYMELIQKIHREHSLNPTGSAVSEWIALIDELLSKKL